MRRELVRGIIGLLAMSFIAAGAFGQGIQLNLSTPGARSLGMGGAFLGLADDATAAYTNPAGLTSLALGGPEIAVEMRSWGYSTGYMWGGRDTGSLSGVGIDGFDEPLTDEAQSDTSGLSFLSAAYVLPRGFTIAVYQHQLANFAEEYEAQGIFSGDGAQSRRSPPSTVNNSVQIVNRGLAAAYQFDLDSLGSLSLGAGFSQYKANLDTLFVTYFYKPRTGKDEADRVPGGFYGPADFSLDRMTSRAVIASEDSTRGWNAGFLWREGQGSGWSVGGVFRRGPQFRFTADVDFPMTPFVEPQQLGVLLRVPDVWGVGVAYSMAEGKTRLAVDYDHVGWSTQPASKDIGEIHLGLEQVLFAIGPKLVTTLRLGAWTAPSEQVLPQDPAKRRVTYHEKDDSHYAAGLGVVIREQYQIDAAVDFSRNVDTLSFSLVRFF